MTTSRLPLAALWMLLASIGFTVSTSAVGNTDSAGPPPSIGISPARLEIAVGNRTTSGSTTVLNLSDKPVKVKSSLVSFDLDGNNRFRELAPEPGSLSHAMMINPVEFTIPANGSQTVRFAIQPERLNGQGEHRAMLFFSELVDTSEANVKLNFRLGMPIYASVGEVQSVARVHDVKFLADQYALEIDLSSIGNAQVKTSGYYLWWPVADFRSEKKAFARASELARQPNITPPADMAGGRLLVKPVFPGERRSLLANIGPPPEPGDYRLVVHLSAGDQLVQRAIPYAPPHGPTIDSD